MIQGIMVSKEKMKTHITKTYGGKATDLQKIQNRISDIGRELGFYEMGICLYPVSADSPSMLSKRLDGIIASLESDDLVFVQFPTGNGWRFDREFLLRLKAYHARVIILVEEQLEEIDCQILNLAENLLVFSKKYQEQLIASGVEGGKCQTVMSYQSEDQADTIKYILQHNKNMYRIYESCIEMGDNDTVHICMGLHDSSGFYSRYVGIVMKSLLDHTSARVFFHILIDDTVSEINKARLRSVADPYGSAVRFHKIDISQFHFTNQYIKKYSIGTMFRLLIPEIFPELNRIIYLDADLLVLKDISELWNENIDEYTLAAVGDRGVWEYLANAYVVLENLIPRNLYFNAGVLLMNLKRIREKGNLANMVSDFLEKYPECYYPDQDALNCLFYRETKLLDASWNVFANYARMKGLPLGENIYHYVGQKYIEYEKTQRWDLIFWEYRINVPWPNQDIINEYCRALRSSFEHVYKWEKLSRVLWEKERTLILCGYECVSVNQILTIFPLREKDRWIKDVDEKTIIELKNLVMSDVDQYVLLVLPEMYHSKMIETLEQWGLEYDKNYFVIPGLMTGTQGGYML